MKYVQQFAIILAVSFSGECLNYLLPFPVPASIYGLLLMLGLLISGALKLEQVRDAAGFLIGILPVLFIPAGTGLMDSWNLLRPVLIPFAVITVLSTFLIMGVTGFVTQKIILCSGKKPLTPYNSSDASGKQTSMPHDPSHNPPHTPVDHSEKTVRSAADKYCAPEDYHDK